MKNSTATSSNSSNSNAQKTVINSINLNGNTASAPVVLKVSGDTTLGAVHGTEKDTHGLHIQFSSNCTLTLTGGSYEGLTLIGDSEIPTE